MQWLINIIQEWIQLQGYLTAAYVHRGDPVLSDFAAGDFDKDNAWHELDLSAIVPSGATSISFTIRVRAGFINQQIRLRRHGNVNETVRAMISTQVANIHNFGDLECACDEDRKIDYRITGPVWTNIDMSVKGWWL